jgi:hypothetical protein
MAMRLFQEWPVAGRKRVRYGRTLAILEGVQGHPLPYAVDDAHHITTAKLQEKFLQ